jgi:hypothetical protein
MRPVKNNRVDIANLHPGDNVFLSSRKMNVVGVNRKNGRVLVTGRKQCQNCEIRWIDARFLGARPRNLVRRKIKSVHDVSPAIIDGLADWVPDKTPAPTLFLPGSREKLDELRARVERGESLWHHHDRTLGQSDAEIARGFELLESEASKAAIADTAGWRGGRFNYVSKQGLIGSRAYEALSQSERERLIRRQFKWDK